MNNDLPVTFPNNNEKIDFFCSQGTAFEQINMFDELDMDLYSINTMAWEIDYSQKTIRRTDLTCGNKTKLTFDEFISCIDKEDVEKIKGLLVPGNMGTFKDVELQIRINSNNGSNIFKIKGKIYNLANKKYYASGMAYDIKQTVNVIKRLQLLNQKDDLTDLNNPGVFDGMSPEILAYNTNPIAVVVANIDNLKDINDTLGYRAGNTLIKSVADVLKECFSDAASIARIAGGEYCAVFYGKNDPEIDMMIQEANMKFHKLYLNLIKTEVTFGYFSSHSIKDFSVLYNMAQNKMQKNKIMKKIVNRESVIDRINDIIRRKAGWGNRCARLQSLALQISYKLGCGEECQREIRILSRIADIGMVGIDDRLLKNRLQLTGKDKLSYLKHIDIGRALIASIDELSQMEGLYLDVYKRYDEWKDGLSLSSRIINGVIGFDDIISSNEAEPYEKVIGFLIKEKGTIYCPQVVDAIICVVNKIIL